jgi:hypothetical protein
MMGMLSTLALHVAGSPLAASATCPAAPALSYAPWDVGWVAALLSLVSLLAGIACIGIVGNLLHWTADDRAPLRPLWMALIALGFTASAAGLYIGLANRAHVIAVDAWLLRAAQASLTCLKSQSASPNITASTVTLSIQMGALAIVLIVAGVVGAVLERRRGSKAG